MFLSKNYPWMLLICLVSAAGLLLAAGAAKSASEREEKNVLAEPNDPWQSS